MAEAHRAESEGVWFLGKDSELYKFPNGVPGEVPAAHSFWGYFIAQETSINVCCITDWSRAPQTTITDVLMPYLGKLEELLQKKSHMK